MFLFLITISIIKILYIYIDIAYVEGSLIKNFEKNTGRPLGTSHINFLGRYILEYTEISTEDGLRELEVKVQE